MEPINEDLKKELRPLVKEISEQILSIIEDMTSLKTIIITQFSK